MNEIFDALQFVKGAISKKDFIPSLKHVLIQDGQIQAFNGHIALNSPVDFEHNVVPVAADFIKAVEQCNSEPKMHVTKGGKLSIKDGSFKVFVKLTDAATFPRMEPEGEMHECNSDIMGAFRTLKPFIGDDASRPWSAGVIIKDGYAYATNNTVLACYMHRIDLAHNVIIPVAAIKELVRIKKPVTHTQLSETSITFHFAHGQWLRCNLLDQKAPDFHDILSQCDYDVSSMQPIPDDLPERILRLKPFMDPKEPQVIFRKEGMFTAPDESGASDTEYSFPFGVFRQEPITHVVGMATHWNLSTYPAACSFVGKDVSGVMIGMRVNYAR